MRAVRVWRSVLGVENTVIDSVELETDGAGEVVVARVRPTPRLATGFEDTTAWLAAHVALSSLAIGAAGHLAVGCRRS